MHSIEKEVTAIC